jgi:ABC-type transport system substrate-binding protein
MLIMDKESYDETALATTPIGTGPYALKEYVTNSHMSVTARDDYWGNAPKIKNIDFKVVNEPAQVINALETKDVDMATITVDDADYVKSLGDAVTVSNGGYTDVVLFSLLDTSPLASKEARYAVSYAIDRQAIVDIVYKGLSTVPHYPASQYTMDFEPRLMICTIHIQLVTTLIRLRSTPKSRVSLARRSALLQMARQISTQWQK